ncbi:Crp/Fnr family transcriptional regulator [Phyllobacterium endophyticum]|uniref:Cyclic nucleotide-binding protein n=1 Tax=Phyllobacterium endophyticum TaxID=1149773 RepID=A0A2P7AR57_9HYPH|nr:Crp/Fnr family transcriptional regulator [Phyllobacterium endophyticum]MBB3237356.1 CRP-like cAMP-binding protein [Phyllobacterium endophyticum]PSH56709.1 cyclic nucleotide-binding protein [Phyllobacterium endophyticum]TYR44307.1 Crp/Fnr family transcriptional regulator [Phyllobacterium endophyticum]
MDTVQSSIQNKLLRLLSVEDFNLLAPDLVYVTFSVRDQIEVAGRTIEHAIFLEDGISSTVAKSPQGRDVEVGLTGYDGVTGTSLVLGGESTPLSVYIQLAGSGYRIAADKFLLAVEKSRSLEQVLLRYIQSMVIQTATTALVNGQADAETRLARWLLMVHDRSSGHNLQLTHEFMSVMLGVRRPWVTETLHLLEGKGYIRSTRGNVSIHDRVGLVAEAGGFYGVAEREYEKLLGVSLSKTCGFDRR